MARGGEVGGRARIFKTINKQQTEGKGAKLGKHPSPYREVDRKRTGCTLLREEKISVWNWKCENPLDHA